MEAPIGRVWRQRDRRARMRRHGDRQSAGRVSRATRRRSVHRGHKPPGVVHDLALSDSPECDIAFALGSCEAEPGKSEAESLRIEGPESSNHTSATFTTTITWTAAAP